MIIIIIIITPLTILHIAIFMIIMVQGVPKKTLFRLFGFGLFVVFWTPLDTDLDTFGLFGRF